MNIFLLSKVYVLRTCSVVFTTVCIECVQVAVNGSVKLFCLLLAPITYALCNMCYTIWFIVIITRGRRGVNFLQQY